MGRLDDEQAVRKHLKVFVGSLPPTATEPQVGHHFARYGQVLSAQIVAPRDSDRSRGPYAFCTFKFAADADCAVVDPQHFPGAQRPLTMGFAAPRNKDPNDKKDDPQGDLDLCKVFVGGIGDRDNEEEVGDFFSQWGLVILVYRDRQWSFVTFATKEAAARILDESSVIFQRRRLDIKASDSKKFMDAAERQDLIQRAIARHFHKKTLPAVPRPGMHPVALPGYPPPAGGYYGAPPPGGGAPPPGPYGAPPPGYYGAPQGGPPPGYPPSGYPPPGYAPPSYPPPGGYYGGAPPGGYYGGDAPPVEGPKALPPVPQDYQPSPGGAPPPAYARDPYAPPEGGAPPPNAGPPQGYGSDYYRDSRDGRGEGRDGYYRTAEDPYAAKPPPSGVTPGVDPYAAPPPQPSHGGHDRYRPY